MARELSTILLATAAGTVKLSTLSSIWEGIKQGKEILDFINELPEWVNYNQNLEEHLQSLRRKMEYLENVRADVTTELENTEHQNGKKRKSEVDSWLRSVRRKGVDVQQVEDSINGVNYLPRFLFRAWLGSRIGRETEQVDDLVQQSSFPTGLLLVAPRDCGEPLVPNVLKGVVVGQKLDEIWGHLISHRTVRIGLQGPEGIGKSAIMAQIYNQLCPFCRVYYVNVPENYSIYRLQALIADEMKVKLLKSEGTETRRAGRIFNMLKRMKEFVLILDGLSQDFDLNEVGIPMEGNAGKLIVTSRSLDVCRRMLCQETVVLEPLSREDSESLFMEKLAADGPLSEEIKNFAENILQKCNGIPLRIINMAIQLRGVSDVNEWRVALAEM